MSVLRVFPNPWAATDQNGLPCGVCPRDPEKDGGGPGQYVGARVDRNRTQVLQKLERGDTLRSPMQRTAYEYTGVASDDPELAAKLLSGTPIELPNTRYYRERIAEGALICADLETAQLARLRGFVPLETIITRHSAPKFAHKPSPEPERASFGGIELPVEAAKVASKKSKSAKPEDEAKNP